MKRIVIILIGLISVAYGQYSPTSAKSRFVNGIALGTKLDAYFAAADSNAIYWRADSALMAKYKGTARRLLFVSDSATYFDQVVRTFGTQTVGGNKTFSNDIVVSGAYLGRRNARNIIFGGSALGLNTTGLANTAIGDTTLFNNTSGNENTAIGYFSMRDNTTGAFNTAIGSQSLLGNTTGETNIGLGGRTLLYNTTGSRNIGIGYGAGEVSVSGTNTTPNKSIYIGYLTRPSAANQTNQIVIGDSAIGNGSNTVTIGNSSVTDNYFSGNVRAKKFTNTGIGSFAFNTANNGEIQMYADSTLGIVLSGRGNTYDAVIANKSGQEALRVPTNTTNVNVVGKLGVGVTSPDNTVHIKSGGDAAIRLEQTGSGYAVITSTDFGILSINADAAATGSGSSIRLLVDGSEKVRVAENGNVTVYDLGTGTVYSNSGVLTNTDPSDSTIKNTINPHKYGLAEVLKLQPKSFYYNSDSTKASLKYGFIAQEVEKIMPDMVRKIDPKDKDSKLGLESQGIYVTMVKAIQEQQAIIEALLTRIKALEEKLK